MKHASILSSLAVVCATCSASAGTMSSAPVTPVVDGADIAQLNENGHSDPGGDAGHIWSNRPLQGQTFTTGANAGGYRLNAVTLRNEENTVNNNGATFEVRIGTVDGSVFTLVGGETSGNPFSYIPDDFITFTFDTPLTLEANTLYGFTVGTSGSGFTTWNNVNTTYPGGEGFSSGTGGMPDDENLVFHGIDREFHLDLDLIIVDDDDGDGLPNQWEIDNDLDPNDDGSDGESEPGAKDGPNGALGDPDTDGSGNANEFLKGTDPQDDDSDDDLLLDGVETGTSIFVDATNTGSNPLVADTDGDSIADGAEVDANPYVTNPNSADTDDDGVGDAAEIAPDPHETDPTVGDTDGDGYDDGIELAKGGDPTDPDSLPDAVLMSVSDVAPVVDGGDIASLTGLVDIGGDPGHVWNNRPRQGQSFTTGADAGGYKLHAITVRVQVNGLSTLAPDWELRIGSLDDSDTFTEVATHVFPGVTIPQSDAANGFSSHVTWSFGVPVRLDANTTYAFDVYANGGGYISLGERTDVFPGGSAYSVGSPGSVLYPASPPDPVTFHGSDRHFHLDISGGGPSIRVIRFERFDDGGGESIRLVWESTPGKTYAVDSSVDLVDWGSEVAGEIVALAETTTFEDAIGNLPQDGPEVFFRVRELIPPPPISTDFESGAAGWTAGPDGPAATRWELGTPGGFRPEAAHSPNNCWGTNIGADYADGADCWLRSPEIDLSGTERATLTWFQWVDIETGDSGTLRILDAETDTELAVIASDVGGLADTWTRLSAPIPAAALNKLVYLEFRFTSNDDTFVYPGWYIDDVEVTIP